ncbi:MAG: SpaA isopeptide-forming pilin-related protein, partial [Bacilli bacterium]
MRKNKGMKQFKKIPKLLMVGMMLVTSIGLNTIDISASTGTMNVETNNNWNRETRDPNYQVWGAYGLITVSGATAFCLESRVLAQSGVTVTQGDPSEVGISIAKAKRMALIQYFGMRLGTGNDYAITQSALWNELGSLEYVSSSSNSSWGSTASYIDTINQKINRYYTKPSTNNKSYEMNVGESMTITDTNDVLKDYDITSTGGLQVTKNENSITITALVSSDDNATIRFTNRITKELSSSNTNVIYKRAGNQTVGSFSATDPMRSDIKVKVNKFGTLNITKQDEDGKLVPNTKFKLSYNANMSNPIGTVTTGANGTVSYDELLPQTVYIQEIGVPKHLVLDSTVKSAKVISNSTVTHIATNKWVKGKVKIRKTDSESGKQVEGATYGIFNEENKEIQRFVTTRNGYIESGYLRFGNYYVKEV